jgi:glycosyltransferase involved in cell wall biosynthesis
MTKLSIITINLNNKKGLLRTITSVVEQTFQDFEYIIIDGGSKDGSVDIIKQYSHKINYWVSEPDSGVYIAMNKGIKKATGKYCLFLNSGDNLVDTEVLRKVFAFQKDKDILYGDVFFGKRKVSFPQQLDLAYFIKSSLGHPSTFIKRDLFDKIGYYNESLKIVADWEFFLNAIVLGGCSYQYLEGLVIARFSIGGASMVNENEASQLHEKEIVLTTLLPSLQATHAREISELLVNLGEYSRSKLVHMAAYLDKTFLVHKLKNLYHSI